MTELISATKIMEKEQFSEMIATASDFLKFFSRCQFLLLLKFNISKIVKSFITYYCYHYYLIYHKVRVVPKGQSLHLCALSLRIKVRSTAQKSHMYL